MQDRISKEQTDALEAGHSVILNLEQAQHLIKFLPHASILSINRVPASKNLYQVRVEGHQNV